MISTTIQTRGYELDATKTIPPAIMLRYMEWGRWEFFNHADIADHQSINNVVVASQSLAILTAVKERINLTIRVWLSRLGNSSMDISQLISETDTNKIVALGRATLVNVDKNHRPSPISDSTKQFLESSPSEFDSSLFPKFHSKTPSRLAKTIERRVMASEIDLLKHVNHSRYVDYVEDARKFAQSEKDLSQDSILALTIEYINEATHGQLLAIATWPTENRCEIQSQISCDGAVLANAIVVTQP